MADIKSTKSLDKEIESEMSNLAHMQPGQEEHDRAVDSLTKLIKTRVEVERLKSEQIDRIIKAALEAGKHLTTLTFMVIWMDRGFRFEETGSISSSMFRSLMSNFKLPKL